jgi:glycerol-1-phosphate dehydrogenase [NAD(P)+]
MADKKIKIDIPEFFEIGDHKTTHLHKIFNEHKIKFSHVLLLGDHKTFLIGVGPISHDLENKSITVSRNLISDSDMPNVDKVEGLIKSETPDLVIGFGGGKVTDVGKLAAGRAETQYITVPTTLSNDGIASPVAVIRDEKNVPVSHITRAPLGVVVDVSIIKKAPSQYIMAGIGDMISNLSAVWDARLARIKNKELVNTTALSLAEAGSINLLLYKYPSITKDDFLKCLARGLTKSGVAMCIVGSSRPSSGSEHKISHAIDQLFSPRKTSHGEQVGITSLFTMAIQDNKYLDMVKSFYNEIAFPHKLQHLRLTDDDFIKAIHHAKTIRPDRFTVLEDINLSDKDIKSLIKKAGLY